MKPKPNAYVNVIFSTEQDKHNVFVGEGAKVELVDGAPIRDANGKIIGTVLSFDEFTGKVSLKIDDFSTIVNTK